MDAPPVMGGPLSTAPVPLGLQDVVYRPVEPTDVDRVKELHEAWFPVRYEDAFYTKVVNCGADHRPYFTTVATLRSTGLIVGMVTANVIAEDDCDEKDDLLSSLSFSQRKVAYILTLGVDAQYRQNGLGRIMLDMLRQYLEGRSDRCHAMYLHCLSTNYSALRFYERMLFEQVKLQVDFYNFHGANHNAVTLVRCIGAGRRPWSMADVGTLLWRFSIGGLLSVFQGSSAEAEGQDSQAPLVEAGTLTLKAPTNIV
jgi:ribosomal protein S18 acetylase RimI-like enzyme